MRARTLDVDAPILTATLESNRRQIDRAFHMVSAAGSRRVGLLGLAFKAGTDDLRESPLVSLVEMLIGKGMEVAIFDRDVRQARLTGQNKDYIEREIPHIWSLMRSSVDEVLDASETVIIGNGSADFRGVRDTLRDGQVIVDLVRAFGPATSNGRYQGISW